MSLTSYITLGNSGLRVSPLCLGTMTFGEEWGVVGTSIEESLDVLCAYLQRGGNFIGTANGYTKGHSEKIIGDYFSEHASRRDRTVIATKFCGNMHPGDPNGGGAGRKAILHQVEDSLRRLQTDYIDLLWVHFWDRHTPLTETMSTLNDLVRAGKVRYIGFSDHPAWVCVEAMHIARENHFEPLIALPWTSPSQTSSGRGSKPGASTTSTFPTTSSIGSPPPSRTAPRLTPSPASPGPWAQRMRANAIEPSRGWPGWHAGGVFDTCMSVVRRLLGPSKRLCRLVARDSQGPCVSCVPGRVLYR